MSENSRVQQLLDEVLDSDRTPEEVCFEYPNLLPEVIDRWNKIRSVQAKLHALFPSKTDVGVPKVSSSLESMVLPKIAGYEVEAVLGRGGMGVVFRAQHLRLKRVVALKMLLSGEYAGQQERERFQREAEAEARLRHPNIVQIFDVGESGGRTYFTMEYIEGGSLGQKLAGTPQPAIQAADLMITLANAVQAAHQCGIVHRDLKPSNILLTADGTPKISDFGLARRLDGEASLTRTGIPMGTPSYMAPEQASGDSLVIGPAVDIYALGAILYELLTGRPPFMAASTAETIQQVITQTPVPPSRLNSNVTRDLETICLKCLHKEPLLRYDTAAHLADDLKRVLRGEAILARPDGLLGRWTRRIRRRPVLSAAIAASSLFVFALIGCGLWLISDRMAATRALVADQAATEQAIADDLKEMHRLQKENNWQAARVELDRAKARLGERGSTELRHQLEQCDRELSLAALLDEFE